MTRQELIEWVLHMRELDEDYARGALRWYAELLPFWDLMAGVREALQHEKAAGSDRVRVERRGA